MPTVTNSPLYGHYTTLALVLVLAGLMVVPAEGCVSLHGEARSIMDAREILNTADNVQSCLRKSLQRGETNFAQNIIDLYDAQYEKALIDVFDRQLQRLKQIQQSIVLSENTCEPVLKWGQSLSQVFVSLKLSHRWDSPPCLNTRSERMSLSTGRFSYENVCVVSHQKITFEVGLELFGEVQEGAELVKDGVGTYSIIMEKKEHRVWPFLAKDEKSYQIWGEIAERYSKIHQQHQLLYDDAMRIRRSKPSEMSAENQQRQNQEEAVDQAQGSENSPVLQDL